MYPHRLETDGNVTTVIWSYLLQSRLIVCLVLSGLWVNCGTTPEDPPVAEVGSHQISSASLRAYISQLPAGLRPQKSDDDARVHHLQALIDRRLLLMEAETLRLDTVQSFRNALRNAVDARVAAIYRSREFGSKISIEEEEISRYFKAEGYYRERKFSAILTASRGAIDSVVAELAAGRAFAELAKERSIDPRSSASSGELGFMALDLAPRMHVPPEVFRDLPLGQVSEPLKAGRNWHVVLFTEDRPVALTKFRDAIRTELYRQRRGQIAAAHYELLENTFAVELQGAALNKVVEAYRRREPRTLRDDPAPTYTWAEGDISLGEVQSTLERFNITSGLTDSSHAAATLRNFVLVPFLVRHAALAAGYYEDPDIQRLQTQKRQELILEGLRKTVVGERFSLGEEDVRRYYDEHPALFQHGEASFVEELLVPTSAEADTLRGRLQAGATVVDFIDRSLRSDAVARKGRFHFHRQDTLRYPILVQNVMAARIGAWNGPVEVEGGYSVFRVLEHTEAAPEPFEEAGTRARALLHHELEGRELGQYLQELRQKYDSQIKIYQDRLAEAVPDSLVRG
jgi:parvulin-like peptidyl-prolyl isomerase